MNKDKIDIYRKLQQHLDKLPIGFPSTSSGIEIKLLKRFFSPDEAEIATKLNFQPDNLENIHKRIKTIGITELEKILDQLAEKGVINAFKKDNVKFYSNIPLVVGIYEYQLNNLTKGFLEEFNQYMDEAFREEFTMTKIPQLRAIPLEVSITPEHSIATYDDIRKIIEAVDLISVSNCICRQSQDILGQPCKVTNMREICLQFQTSAKIYLEKGFGRQITKNEAFKILKKAEEEGLVLQPANTQRPSFICLCCGCCCEIMVNKKKLHQPAEYFASNYFVKVDKELCTGCETCLERCQMDALKLVDNISTVDRTRCIGCGVCVPTCPSGAISLQKKEQEIIPPKNTAMLYKEIMEKKLILQKVKTE